MLRSSSFRRWLRASTLVVGACAGSVLLFHNSEASAWDTEGHDTQHDGPILADGGTASHDGGGWLRNSNTWLRNGWHPIGTKAESCSDVLSFRGERGEDGKSEGSTITVNMGVNFRVRNCVDHYECNGRDRSNRINSTWDENHRHSHIGDGTGNPGDHEYSYRVSLDGAVKSHGVTADDLTCGGDGGGDGGGDDGDGDDDDEDDGDDKRRRYVCDSNTDLPGLEVLLSPGETWLGDGGVREAVCFTDCDASTPSGAVVTRGDLDGERWFWVGTNQQSGSRWRVTWNGRGGSASCPGYEVRGSIEEIVLSGNSPNWSVFHRSLFDGYNIYPERYPNEGNTKQGLLAFTGSTNLSYTLMPVGPPMEWYTVDYIQDQATAHEIRNGSLRSLWASRTGELKVARGTAVQVGFPLRLYEAGVGRATGTSNSLTHPVYEHRIGRYGSSRARTFTSTRVSRHIYDIEPCRTATSTNYFVTPPRVEKVPVCGGVGTTATGPWHCPASGALVRPSRALWSIPAEIGDAYNAVAADTNATAEQRAAAAWRLYDYCRDYTPTVTLVVPDGYRDAQPDETTVEVTFTKHTGDADCPTQTATYLPNATDGEQATPVTLSGGRVRRDANGNPVDEHGNPVAPPSLNADCTYAVSYPASAAGGDLRLDSTAAGHDVEVSADAPQTQATYEEAFLEPQGRSTFPTDT